MNHGDVRALEDEQDPERRRALIRRLALSLTPNEVEDVITLRSNDLAPYSVLHAYECGLPMVTCSSAPCAHCGYEGDYLAVTIIGGLDTSYVWDGISSHEFIECMCCRGRHSYVLGGDIM